MQINIHYLDVGQGDCTVIHIQDDSDNYTIVMDCGTTARGTLPEGVSNGGAEKTASQILLNSLSSNGITRIDTIIISHYDVDHYNGITLLLEKFVKAKEKSASAWTEDDRKILALLNGVKIFDPGISYEKALDIITDVSKDPSETAIIGFNEKDIGSYKGFTGYNLYHRYSQAIINGADSLLDKGLKRQTEGIFVGHWTQYKNKQEPFPAAPNTDEIFKIQKTLWKPSCLTTAGYQNNPISFSFWQKEVISKKISGKRRPEKKTNYKKLHVHEEAFQVNRLPIYDLLGKDLLEGKYASANIKLICVTVNGYAWAKKENKEGEEIGEFEPTPALGESINENCFSLGVVLQFNDFVHWFGGDAESDQEDKIVSFVQSLNKYGLTAMKASHHGSNKSSSANFLEKMKPKVVVISAGQGNQLPGPDTLNRLNDCAHVKKVILTGWDEYTADNASRLPDAVPFDNTISDDKDKFFIAGSPNDVANIILNISENESKNGGGTLSFTDKNQKFVLTKKSVPGGTPENPKFDPIAKNEQSVFTLIPGKHQLEAESEYNQFTADIEGKKFRIWTSTKRKRPSDDNHEDGPPYKKMLGIGKTQSGQKTFKLNKL